ncbi:SCO6745 family protein [Nocardioides jiangxiensis]|uniref:SalK n=1 Tax=Nocardioides jiangxiensis TaxID=3064524 RepID=A0ABT9B4R7_9ACTN|nr:hypothetical protein [Nocardioides sp. WY-20]MDO7869309.1 hypothetical protein [Nocardioides sp. WY-20]
MTDRPRAARRLWQLLEPVHAVTYFSPEPLAALTAAGYRGFWMGYFAGRAAPLGPVGPDVVLPLFHNFAPAHVARALPDAWSFAPPEHALSARLEGSVAALRRILGPAADDPGLRRAADLAYDAACSAPTAGRALFTANLALPVPAEPLPRLWHAATLLREHRGDGHVKVLVDEGVDGRTAHVLHALTTGIPAEVYAAARRLGPAEWASILDDLATRGLVAGGLLTDAGRALKTRVEDRTDELAATAYAAVPDAEIDELTQLLRPLTRAVVAAGDIPAKSPMGLDLQGLAD